MALFHAGYHSANSLKIHGALSGSAEITFQLVTDVE